MTSAYTDVAPQISPETTPDELGDLIAEASAGTDVGGLLLLESEDGLRIVLPGGLDYARAVLVDGHIVLVQPDGTVVVLLGAADRSYLLQIEDTTISVPSARLTAISYPEGSWNTLGDVEPVDIPQSITDPSAIGSAVDPFQVDVVDPLVGLPWHPLLPPTEYEWPERREEEYAGGAGPSGVHVDPLDPNADAFVVLDESDDAVSFRLSNYYEISFDNTDATADFVYIQVELSGLPDGTEVSAGALTPQSDGTLSFSFSGSISDFESLVITLPKDFSTDSRIDAPTGILNGTITATSELGDEVTTPLTIRVRDEADITLDGPGALELAETDAPVDFRPADALSPTATDIDGSEHIEAVTFTMPGLPDGTLISYDGGTNFTAVDGNISFTGSLGDYRAIVIRLPTDFSTQNPASSLTGKVSATTNEGGRVSDEFEVALTYELDVDLSAPATLQEQEDSRSGDGSGVELFLGIDVAATDKDGSEDSTYVEITYIDAPEGLSFNGGSYNPETGTWTGTMAEANALVLHLPGDYSGTLSSTIRAIGPEGTRETSQVLEIAPVGDIDFDVSDLVRSETDAQVTMNPSSVWQVSVSDFDPAQPHETLNNVTLKLDGVPAGMTWTGVPGSTIAYDAGAGTLVFTGTGAQYAALRLTFPTDFSTESRNDGITQGPITGTLSATSNEDPEGQSSPVSLAITPEGDVRITNTGSGIGDETDNPITVTPYDLMVPEATDADGSETLQSLVLVVRGLPSDFDTGTVVAPAAAIGRLVTEADGSTTLTITLDATTSSDIAGDYAALMFDLPADFSTTNRVDIDTGTALPLIFTLTAVTDEDQDLASDTAVDGQQVLTRTIDVNATPDLEISVADVSAIEDADNDENGVDADGDGIPDDDGVTVDLGIATDPGDIDGSEDNYTVEIAFSGLPAGVRAADFTDGTSADPIGTFHAAANVWKGTPDEARVLHLHFPGDYSGVVTSEIRAVGPEGTVTASQTITIAPAGDAIVEAQDVALQEIDAPVAFRPSTDWQSFQTDADGSETLTTVTLALQGVPAGMSWTGVPGSTIAFDADAGTLVFTGTGAQYDALWLVFPKDFSTGSRGDGIAEGPITGTLSAVSNEDPIGSSTPVSLTITPEGDVAIDNLLPYPDLIEDQQDPANSDDPYPILPWEVLRPGATDIDGSEALSELVLTVEGLPSTDENGDPLTDPIDGSYLSLEVDPGAEVVFEQVPDGSVTMTITLTGATVDDVAAAYEAIRFSVPHDFSTANRADLNDGDTALPLTFTLRARTDEEPASTTDPDASARDGLEEKSRIVEIDFLADIDLDAPPTLTTDEDGGPNSKTGTFIDFEIDISIGDIDGSETDGDPATDIFAAVVSIRFFSTIPDETRFVDNIDPLIANEVGTYDPITRTWTGTVAEANVLVAQVPADVSGAVSSRITVTTREGVETAPQYITITPTPDVEIDGEVITEETDAPLEVDVGNFVTALDLDENETLVTLDFTMPGLPAGTMVIDVNTGNPVGTLTPEPGGTLTLGYSYDGTGIPPTDVRIVFPTDYSTENPALDPGLEATLTVITQQGGVNNAPATSTIPFTIRVEGDVDVPDAEIALSETDAPITFRPSDHIMPEATDQDGSESITGIDVEFVGLPEGARYDIGTGFTAFTDGRILGLSEAEYATLVIELPTDFSTENPPTQLLAQVIARTDEGGEDVGTLTVDVAAEGDILVEGDGIITLEENDPPNGLDNDDTTTDPVEFRLIDLVAADPDDADDSESIISVTVTVDGLPEGTLVSIDNGTSFIPVTNGTFELTAAQYDLAVVRLPDDFSTESRSDGIAPGPISGTVTFVTDEDRNGLDDGPDDGVETRDFQVTVTPEADIAIATVGITEEEDFIGPLADDPNAVIPLNLDVQVTDQDGSETLQSVTVTFDGLPPDGAVISDGTGTDITVTPGSNTITFTGSFDDAARIQALAITSLPPHFSGRIVVSVEALSNEGGTVSDSFDVDIAPVAEPTIDLSVTVNAPAVTEIADDNFIVKEDNSFVLTFDARTPDNVDGSEELTRIVIENIPEGWTDPAEGDITGLLVGDTAQLGRIESATVSGTTITITLAAGVTSIRGGLTLAPLADDDRDVATILGEDIRAAVTSVDRADSIPDTNTASAQDTLDMDVDAVVDPASGVAQSVESEENTNGPRYVELNFNNIALSDTDGSETIYAVDIAITVDTASDMFDPTSDMQLVDSTGFIQITATGSTADSVSYSLVAKAGVSQADFTTALEGLRLSFPQHFSGVASIEGDLLWNETQTGDVEIDLSDNDSLTSPTVDNTSFSTTVTVAAVAEAILTASVFTLNADEVADSTQSISDSIKDGSFAREDILTLLESTADGSSEAGQVHLFVSLAANTPDTDGSEELHKAVIRNIPTAWIAHDSATAAVDRAAFFSADGTGPISDAEWAKIESAIFDETTGELAITFVDDQLDFAGSVRLAPSLYEDYDVNRSEDYAQSGDFSSAGDFFEGDLTIEVTTRDQTTLSPATEQPDEQSASLEFDVDVDPVNNFAAIDSPAPGNEQEIDDAGGVWTVSLLPLIEDMDGSEEITAIVLRNVPNFMTIYVRDPDDPDGPRIPALITELGVSGPDSSIVYNYWSLDAGQWEDIEIRGIPTHFSGNAAAAIDVVTTETDGGGTRVTTLTDVVLTIDPVTDGGNPSENATTHEDVPVQVIIDGNIRDNQNNSPQSPEAIDYPITLTLVDGDEFADELPRFFYGDTSSGFDPDSFDPESFDPDNPPAGMTELPLVGDSTVTLTDEDMAQNLWVLPRQDGNNPLLLDVEVTYYETVDPDGVSSPVTATGRLTIDVTGIADDPEVSAQEDDPRETSGSLIADDDDVDDVYEADASYGIEKIYGYAGYAHVAFSLTQRLSDDAISNGFPETPDDSIFTVADPLSGTMTEIQDSGGNFDSSEIGYYVITGVPGGSYLYGPGVQLLDPAAGTYLVSAGNLASVQFLADEGVSDPTFYDLTLYGIVYENDQEILELTGSNIAENMALIDAQPGGAVTEQSFSVVILPNEGEGEPCVPVDPPQLTFTPEQAITLEDEDIVLRPTLDSNDPNYDSLADLSGTLPNGQPGSVTIAIELPPGATIASDPPGAVYLDPTTGNWVVDITKLGISADGLTTDGSISITPPPHQSSPAPFGADETIGPNDPNYDNLDQINFTMTVNSVGCPPGTPQGNSFSIYIDPVPDGPIIVFTGDDVVKEDETVDLGLMLDQDQMDIPDGMDGGERLYGTATVSIDGGGTLYAGGVALTPEADGTYAVTFDDLAGLSFAPPENFGGDYITISVTAQTQDVDGDLSAPVTAERQIYVDAVADTPQIDFDLTQIDPDTGNPYIEISGATAILTIIEDIPFFAEPTIVAYSPDQDGSEAVSIVVDMREAEGLTLSGPAQAGFIDNGDGTYTISESAFANVYLELDPEHARTPDDINNILAEFPVRISIQTLETDFITGIEDQSDNEATTEVNFIVRVRPDADLPGVNASANPNMGTEDDLAGIALTISGTTPDPHETMEFQITLPTDGFGNPVGQILLGGVAVDPVDGVVTVLAGGRGGPGRVLLPEGTVTFLPPEDFAGDVSLTVVAVSIDSVSAGSIFLDLQPSDPATIDLSITPTPDLSFSVGNAAVALTETDDVLSYVPANDITVEVTDIDDSEVGTVIYTLTDVPDGTTWTSGDSSGTASGGVLAYTGTDADFQTLEIAFPADFATNGTAIAGSVEVTTNEGGSGSGSFTIDVAGELDVSVTGTTPIVVTRGPGEEIVEFGIDASVIPATNEWETLEEVIIDFDTALPVGTSAPTGGTLNADRTQLVLSRNGTDPAAFAAAIAALSVAIPLDRAEDFTATVTVTSSHGTADPVPFEVVFETADVVPGMLPLIATTEMLIEPSTTNAEIIAAPTAQTVKSNSTSDEAPPQTDVAQDASPLNDDGQSGANPKPVDISDSETLIVGTDGNDTFIVDDTFTSTSIDGFALLGGDDLLDLSGAMRGFEVDGGQGDDTIVGSAFADILTGGDGADRFVLAGPTLADVITDYDAESGDAVDLSALIRLTGGEAVEDRASYEATTGDLSVDGECVATVFSDGGRFASEVEVIFEDAAGQQASAMI